jgi:hypothetical protein
MSDEISAAISESISDLSGSDADTSVDTTTDLAPSGESAAVGDPAGDPAVDGDAPPPETDPTTGDPVQRQMSRSQKRIMQLVEQQKAAEAKWQADLAERDNRLKEFEWAQDPQARLLNNGMQLMLTDKQRFVNEVLLKDPDYQNLIALKEAQAQAAVNQPEPLPNFPEPDTLFGDGTPGHSPQVIAVCPGRGAARSPRGGDVGGRQVVGQDRGTRVPREADRAGTLRHGDLQREAGRQHRGHQRH